MQIALSAILAALVLRVAHGNPIDDIEGDVSVHLSRVQESQAQEILELELRMTRNFESKLNVLQQQHEEEINSIYEKLGTLVDDPKRNSDRTLQDYANKRLMKDVAKLKNFSRLLSRVSESSTRNNLVFSGCNVQIDNGFGSTESTNGFGNLIVGYNEDDQCSENCKRKGSHNIVAGTQNNYESYGGIVVGSMNEISKKFASVTGGMKNSALGDYSSVSGPQQPGESRFH